MKQIKPWLITASAPLCGTDTYYVIYSECNPELLDVWNDITGGLTEELWDSYSWLLHLDDEDYDSEEEEAEAYDQAYEDWCCDCSFTAEEMDLELDNPEDYEVLYDERKNDSTSS